MRLRRIDRQRSERRFESSRASDPSFSTHGSWGIHARGECQSVRCLDELRIKEAPALAVGGSRKPLISAAHVTRNGSERSEHYGQPKPGRNRLFAGALARTRRILRTFCAPIAG